MSATPENTSTFTQIVGPLSVWMEEATSDNNGAAPVDADSRPGPHPADRLHVAEPLACRVVLHRRFSVKQVSYVAFSIPPNQPNPKLNGSFESRLQDGSVEPPPADIDLMVLNEDEFQAFRQHRGGDATFATNPSHNLTVNYAVPPTHEKGQQYYLLFRNLTNRQPVLVAANFTLSFE